MTEALPYLDPCLPIKITITINTVVVKEWKVGRNGSVQGQLTLFHQRKTCNQSESLGQGIYAHDQIGLVIAKLMVVEHIISGDNCYACTRGYDSTVVAIAAIVAIDELPLEIGGDTVALISKHGCLSVRT